MSAECTRRTLSGGCGCRLSGGCGCGGGVGGGGLSGGGFRPRAPRDKGVKSPAGWGVVKPHKMSERRELPASCFLSPPTSYPICNKNTGSYECRGLLAAKKRAMLVASKPSNSPSSKATARSVARRAVQKARGFGCAWARRGEPQASLRM